MTGEIKVELLQDMEGIIPSAKVMRLTSTDSQEGAANLMFGAGAAASTSGSVTAAVAEGPSTIPVLKEPLKKALTGLFRVIKSNISI
jgi:phosphoribosylcarboxyaminoimidazole (NCAIR) mutase